MKRPLHDPHTDCHISCSQKEALREDSQLQNNGAGTAEPLGPSKISETAKSGVNFALYSEHATSITLVLSDRDDKNVVEIPLEPEHHRTANVWHAAIEGCPLSGVLYVYRVDGQTGWDAGDRCSPFGMIRLLFQLMPTTDFRQVGIGTFCVPELVVCTGGIRPDCS